MNKVDVNNNIIRWLLLLQEFDLTIMDKPKKHNVVENLLSRLECTTDQDMVEDVFPDENLFVVSTRTPWFADMEN